MALHGLFLALELGLTKVELEGNSINVWRSIKVKEGDRSYNGNILRDILLFSSCFRSFKYNFVSGHCNRVADMLAKSGKDSLSNTWLEQAPNFLDHVLYLDS